MEKLGNAIGGNAGKVSLPRLYHTKSRKGCQRCRARRVKCDETQPICHNCHRHNVPCIYTNTNINTTPTTARPPSQEPPPNTTKESSSHPTKNPRPDLLLDYRPCLIPNPNPTTPTPPTAPPISIPETTTRRLLELHLLQNFITRTSTTFSSSHNPEIVQTWSIEVPQLALLPQNANLLYGILSISALHLLSSSSPSSSSPSTGEDEVSSLRAARETYHTLALTTQRQAIETLNTETAEAVCFASSLLLIDVFAQLRDRDREPYTPPMRWFHMARGSGSVFGIAFNELDNFETSKLNTLATTYPLLTRGHDLFSPDNLTEDLTSLLLPQTFPNEPWDSETRDAYQMTAAYIGGIERAVRDGEHQMGICRRMMAFALLVPKAYVGFVEEGRGRALFLLKAFFECGRGVEGVWWVGNTCAREVGVLRGWLGEVVRD